MMLFAELGPENLAPETLLWGFLGVAFLAVIVLIFFLLFRHLHTVRQFTHTERMRSLEAGFPLEAQKDTKAPVDGPEDKHAGYMHNSFWISFWLVVSVPAAALSAASTGTKTVNGSLSLSIVIWFGAAIVSIAAVVCATVLMLKSRPGETEKSGDIQKTRNSA